MVQLVLPDVAMALPQTVLKKINFFISYDNREDILNVERGPNKVLCLPVAVLKINLFESPSNLTVLKKIHLVQSNGFSA